MNALLKKLFKQVQPDSHHSAVHKPDEDFIPYVCHYDQNTILTKNGELMQVMRITGFSDTALSSQLVSLRDSVRESIADHVKDNRVAFWLNTIRRKKNINPLGKHQGFFSEELNKTWVDKYQWDDQYVNELYITVIVEGFDTSISNMKSFWRSFSYLSTKSLHYNYLKEARKKLATIVNSVKEDTQAYGVKLLGIRDWDGVLYSEPMRFFGKICNLYEERYPLAANDISTDLSGHKMAFGDRQLEVVGDHNKNFAAMLSLKEYSEVSTSSLDRILKLPFEFIITQSFDFAFAEKELEPYEYQDYIFKVSGDDYCRDITGIADFIDNKKGKPTDYGKLQTTIMVIADSKTELEKDVGMVVEKFGSLGLVTVREDLYLEHCFWSQLPGNFSYLSRQKLINTNTIAGFAALHSYPQGAISDNHWGPAVTVFKTILNTPYFFNFHDGNLGHSLFVGVDYYENLRLVNFLLSQSDKFGATIFHFDFGDISKAFVEVSQGHYYNLVKEPEEGMKPLKINPLLLEKNDANEQFLCEFFTSMIAFSKKEILEDERKLMPQIVQKILASKLTKLKDAIECFNNPKTPTIYSQLKIWCGDKYAHIFNAEKESDLSAKITAFNLTENLQQKPVLIPIFLYLLHKIEAQLDATSPTILVLNEAWELFDNDIIAPKFIDFLDRAKEKNSIVIMTSTSANQVAQSEMTQDVRQRLGLEVFLPNDALADDCIEPLGLNAEEADIIRTINSRMGHFLFKQADNSVIASFSLKDHIAFDKLLASNEETLKVMQEVRAKHQPTSNADKKDNKETKKPVTPEDDGGKTWISPLLKNLNTMEEVRVAAEKKKMIAHAAQQRQMLKEKLKEGA